MVDPEKILKECRDERDDLNNNLEKSKKINLLIQSEAKGDDNSGYRRPPLNPSYPTNISAGGGITHNLSLYHSQMILVAT